MKAVTIESVEAPSKWSAAADANMRNLANKSCYDNSQQILAERTKLGLEMVYSGKVFLNYRKKFITLKIADPVVKDSKNLRLLEKQYESDGIVKVVSAQGILYRIPQTK